MGFQRFLLSRCTHWSAYYTTTPQNAQDASIAWTTSDPEIAEAKFKKYFKVNAKAGKITVKKGLKEGKYTVKIKVSASGDGNYLPAAKTVKVIVNVR